MIESWKAIDGFPNYMISNIGSVRNIKTGRILVPIKNKEGYLSIKLCNKGHQKGFRINRLVAQYFIPNPDNLPVVNHINEIKTDNRVENLEWCTDAYNSNYGTRTERMKRFGIEHHKSKSVFQFSKDGEFIKKWNCISDIQREIGINVANISKCCYGRAKTAGGYKWSFHISDCFSLNN